MCCAEQLNPPTLLPSYRKCKVLRLNRTVDRSGRNGIRAIQLNGAGARRDCQIGGKHMLFMRRPNFLPSARYLCSVAVPRRQSATPAKPVSVCGRIGMQLPMKLHVKAG